MGRKVLFAALSIFALALIFAPDVSSAHDDMPFPYFGQGGLLSCTGGAEGSNLPKCQSICDALHTGQHILYFAISMGIVVVLPIMVFWGGIVMLTSFGNPEKVTAGRKIITSAAIGVVIILVAFVIVNTFFFIAAQIGDPGTLDINWSRIQCTPK